uniref:Uncharacterized protein n=1 Tax=Ascaris lumbricoides TaxID=6252 RepID=A0A9J2Q676_ASCLU
MEEGPDVVELPDSDEELARIQTADALVAQQAYSAEIERRPNCTSQRLLGWNNPYNAPPFYSSQFAYQQQPYQVAPTQHLALTCSQPRQYGMTAQRSASVMHGVQATTTSEQKNDQTTLHFGMAHPPRFFVSHESFDGSLQSVHQQSKNCSAQPVVAGYSLARIDQVGFRVNHQQDCNVAPLSALPNRPTSFEAAYVDVLRRTKLNAASLIEVTLSFSGNV